ncbi:hypothetical protein ACH5RR_020741 [Cinchona calisaya]|uniref:Uncharacterized protein n=1 Tax=Cinchona calisaya TaxID=153742 RepID=A0ABD2ZIA9_9GENT
MPQLERSGRYTDTPTPKTPKAPNSPTFGQLLQGDESWQLSTSPRLSRNYDTEEDFGHHGNKKSVLTRVKEKARKFRHSLSMKKKHDNEILDGQTTPSWGVSLEDNDDDDDERDEDPEYLGAPMYESELAPEAYRETARQHPRADPVVPENHLWPTSNKHEDEEKDKPAMHSKTITETVTEKLAPAYAAVSDATHTIASKIAGLTISGPEDQQQKHRNTDMSPEIREELSHRSPHVWDKGVSVKEYVMNKFEPGEEDRALSQVISKAISPTKNPLSNNETTKATNLSSNIPISRRTQVPPPNSTSSTNVNSLQVPNSPRASSTEEPSKETFKKTNLSSNISILTKKEVQPPNYSLSSGNINSSSHVPISQGASSIKKPNSKETTKATNLSSNIPLLIKTEVPPLSPISSTKANSSAHVHIPRGARPKEESSSKETMKATNLSSQLPHFIKTEIPLSSSISSANVNSNSSSRVPLSRNANLSPHVPVFHDASSAPLVPISTNAQEG